MIRCIAIDDEPLALRQLSTYINNVPYLQLVSQFQSALEARTYLQDNTVDAIFCDINMPDLNGMDFVKSLPMPPHVIFTTAYSEYAVDGFKVNAVDYLLKPFGQTEFLQAANRLRDRYESTTHDDSIFLKTNYHIVKVHLSDIRYIESMSEYLKIYAEGHPKPIITLLSMKKIQERLPNCFMRIHRSYIINLNKIQEISKNRVIMDSGGILPIGDMYRETFFNYLDTRFLSK